MAKSVFDKFRARQEYLLVYSELLTAARYRGVVTYQHLAKLIGLPLKGSYMGSQIGQYLGAICEAEHRLKRPLLSAVAVSSKDSPGPGFYGVASYLGRFRGGTREQERAFWLAEREAVYAVWKPVFPERVKGAPRA